MKNALNDIVTSLGTQRFNEKMFAVSRLLRLAMTTFQSHLMNWQIKTSLPTTLECQAQRSEVLSQSLNLYDPEIRDSYQIYRDKVTLKDARRSIEMAEKSIEMSEKSIKESERVRICKSLRRAISFMSVD